MKSDPTFQADTYHRLLEALRIGNLAVRKAQRKNREAGIANVYARPDGTPYWELPNGEITFEDPYRPGGPLADDACSK